MGIDLKSLSWPQGSYALRLIVAALLALFVSQLLPGAHGFSAVISALIVVRPYSQGALKAGAMRLVATLIGIALAFAASVLHGFGLNDYERLLIGLAPLAILVAYNSDYRSALIAAVLMLGASSGAGPINASLENAAVARAVVVGIGAIIGVAVSVLILPTPHRKAVSEKALTALDGLVASLTSSFSPQQAERAEAKLRKSLLELSQMHRDNGNGHADDDPSGLIVRLTRHAQAVVVLLRSEWRREAGEGRDAYAGALRALIAAARKGQPAHDLIAAAEALRPPAEGVQVWMTRALVSDIVKVVKLSA